MPLVNVIIPVYNRPDQLKRAVKSVITQTFSDFDIWIINDGSTDNTGDAIQKIIKENPDKSIYCIKTSNRGVSAARNTGIANSDGKYIALLDSDDEWLPEKLRTQIDYLQKNPETELVHTGEIWIRNGIRVNPPLKYRKYGGDVFIQSLPLCMIGPSTAVFTRSLFNSTGAFREDFPVCEDYDFWLRATSVYKTALIDKPLTIKYGGHADQLSVKYKAMDYWRVLSMYSVSGNYNLDAEKKTALKREIIKKSQILLKGYKKYGNQTKYNEIDSILKKIRGI